MPKVPGKIVGECMGTGVMSQDKSEDQLECANPHPAMSSPSPLWIVRQPDRRCPAVYLTLSSAHMIPRSPCTALTRKPACFELVLPPASTVPFNVYMAEGMFWGKVTSCSVT